MFETLRLVSFSYSASSNKVATVRCRLSVHNIRRGLWQMRVRLSMLPLFCYDLVAKHVLQVCFFQGHAAYCLNVRTKAEKA